MPPPVLPAALLLVTALALMTGCGAPAAPPARTAAPADTAPTRWQPRSFAYQLQNAEPRELARAGVDLYIIDPSRDGSDENLYSAADLAAVRAGRSAVRILAYFSIGEAENYRGYWQASWDANDDGRPDPGAPAWLGPENPDWDGNYAVRYWDPAWQDLILARLDRLVTAGYDGVYLDLVDAFEYWGPDGDQPAPRSTAARDMADFIARLAARARTRNAAFLIVPQNGEALGEFAEYRRLVDGIGREDVWYDGDDRQAGDETAGVLRALKRFQNDGKFVLTIDYPTTAGARAAYYAAADAAGMLALAPPRALDRCVTRAGDGR